MSPIERSGGGGGLQGRSILEAALGIVAEPDLMLTSTSNTTAVSGTIYAMAVGIKSPAVITNMVAGVVTGGAGTAPTLIRQGVADSTGKMLAVTADSHASAQWTAAGVASVALTAPLTITTDGLYYICFIEVGSFGTTALQLRRNSNPGASGGIAGFPLAMSTMAAQTDLPAVGNSFTFSTSGWVPFWLAAS